MLKNVILGNVLRERRLELGRSKEDAARLYGKYIRPIKARTILAIEEGFVPQDPKRRLVLAGVFCLAPAVLGLFPTDEKIIPLPKAKHIDLQESKAVLLHYWKEGLNNPKAAIQDLYIHAASIQSRVLYKSGPERIEMLEILCGLKIWLAHTLREQGYNKNASYHFNDAIILAHEEDFSIFEASALYRRGEFYFDLGEFKKAEKDFERALLIKALPPQVEGRIKLMLGVTKSHLAQTEQERTKAWNMASSTEKLTGETGENQLYLISNSLATYHKRSSWGFMGSPIKRLRDPNKAIESLKESEKYIQPDRSIFPNHYNYLRLENALVEAQIERDRGYYPLAVERAEAAVKMSMEMHTDIHTPLLKSIYEDIRASSYGNDLSVADLGLQLLFLQFPQFLN